MSAAAQVRPGTWIKCPHDGVVEKVTWVRRSRAFVTIRTNRHDHVVPPRDRRDFEVVDGVVTKWVNERFALRSPDRDDTVVHASWAMYQESQYPSMRTMLGLEADSGAPETPGHWWNRRPR